MLRKRIKILVFKKLDMKHQTKKKYRFVVGMWMKPLLMSYKTSMHFLVAKEERCANAD